MPETDNEVYSQKHYTVSKLAALWSVSPDTIRRKCVGEPGVIRLQRPACQGANRRSYVTLRISESAARRIYSKLTSSSEPPLPRPLVAAPFSRRLHPQTNKGVR
jgi:hypothetical protein